jgi:4-amino-4-deoxy-L-arabinose transferase-like glycosyltransferase
MAKHLSVIHKLLFISILLISIALRFVGISPGYPPYHSDEGISYSSAISMIKNKNLDPLRYDYPSLVPLTNYIFFENFFIPFSWMSYYARNLGNIIDGFVKLPLPEIELKRVFQLEILGEREVYALWWGRYTTAFIGVGVVVATYLLAKKLFSVEVGLIAATMLAVSYRHVLNSHLGLPDIYNSFFLLLSCIASLRVYKQPTTRNYFFAAVFAGLSMAVKYQFFAFFPLVLVHILLALRKPTNMQKIRLLFSPQAVAIPIVGVFVFLLLNPYMFIHFEETKAWLASVSGKYRTGRMMLDIFPFSYLYHVGIGEVTSILVVVSLAIYLIKNRSFAFFYLISVLLPFFYVTVFATGGGFYTRNFVTIIPFLIIVAASGFSLLKQILPNKSIAIIFLSVVFVMSLYENVSKSVVIAQEYSRQWNFQELSNWLTKNIHGNAKVSAHSSVPLPINGVTRLPYDFHLSFSIDEFREDGSDLAIANLDWETNDFYWWMTVDTRKGIEYWQKPIKLLQNTYPALALQELSQFSIHSVINEWQAPDSNFVVSEVPEFKVNREISEVVVTPDPINISNWNGFVVEAEMRTTALVPRDGYLYLVLYLNERDAREDENRQYVRLSARNKPTGEFQKLRLVGKVPPQSSYARVGTGVYNPHGASIEVKNIKLINADIEMQTDYTLVPIELDEKVLYPSSHGYL